MATERPHPMKEVLIHRILPPNPINLKNGANVLPNKCKATLDGSHSFKYWMWIDYCTNNFSELVAASALLYWARHLDVRDIRIFRDSRVVIDWLDGKSNIHSINLLHWCARIRKLLTGFSFTSFCHIYREYNMDADVLSKRGLGGLPDHILSFEEPRGSDIIKVGRIKLF